MVSNNGLDSNPDASRLSQAEDKPASFLTQALKDAYGSRPSNKWTGSGSMENSETLIASLDRSDLLGSNDNGANAAEVFDGFLEGAFFRPTKALGQVIGVSDKVKDDALSANDTSKSHKTGVVVGSLIPFVGLVGLTRGASAEILGECCSPPVYRLVGEQATAGFLYGSLFTPSSMKDGEGLLAARLNQGGTSAAIFATLNGTSAALDHALPKADDDSNMVPTIARKLSVSILSGALGEFVDAGGRTSFFSVPVEESISSSVSTAALKSISENAGKLFKMQEQGTYGAFKFDGTAGSSMFSERFGNFQPGTTDQINSSAADLIEQKAAAPVNEAANATTKDSKDSPATTSLEQTK